MNPRPEEADLKDYYDAPYFQGLPIHSNRIKQIFEHIDLQTEDRVCEFGCGIGHILLAIHKSIKYGLGIDSSEYAVTEAAKNASLIGADNIVFRPLDIVGMSSDPGHRDSFEKVLLMDVTEHVYDDVLSGFFKSAHYILVDNGELYIHTPNVEYYIERMKSYNFILKQFPGHVAVRNFSAYKQLLEHAGFAVENIIFLPHYHRVLGEIDKAGMKIPLLKKLFRSRLLIKARRL